MKNILITGGCGFIGSNFVNHIAKSGQFHPIIIDKLTYAGNIDNLKNIQNSDYTFIKGDICDEKTVLTVEAFLNDPVGWSDTNIDKYS